MAGNKGVVCGKGLPVDGGQNKQSGGDHLVSAALQKRGKKRNEKIYEKRGYALLG